MSYLWQLLERREVAWRMETKNQLFGNSEQLPLTEKNFRFIALMSSSPPQKKRGDSTKT